MRTETHHYLLKDDVKNLCRKMDQEKCDRDVLIGKNIHFEGWGDEPILETYGRRFIQSSLVDGVLVRCPSIGLNRDLPITRWI